MGEPIRVVDLAADLIRLSGLEVGTDIEINIIGTRPGEKLSEEMFWGDEVAERTEHEKVLRARKTSYIEGVAPLIERLIEAGRRNAGEEHLRELLGAIVPDFAPAPEASLTMTTPTYGLAVQPGEHGEDEGRVFSPAAITPQRNGRPPAPTSVVGG